MSSTISRSYKALALPIGTAELYCLCFALELSVAYVPVITRKQRHDQKWFELFNGHALRRTYKENFRNAKQESWATYKHYHAKRG